MRRIDLRNFLAPLPRHRLAEVAEHLGLSTQRDVIPNICASLADPLTVTNLVEALSPEASALLRDIIYSGLYNFSISDEEFLSHPQFKELYQSGLVGVGKEYWGTFRIVVPEETYSIIMKLLQEADARAIEHPDSKKGAVELVQSRGETFLRNVTTLLSIAETEGISLTASLEISKPFLKKRLLPVLEIGDYGLTPDGRYPADFFHVWQFINHFEIVRAKGPVAVSGPMAEAFLESPDDILGEALLFYLMEFSPSMPIHWMIERLRMLSPETWVNLDELLERSRPRALPPQGVKEYRERWESVFDLMTMMGVIDAGVMDGEKVIALAKIWNVEHETPTTRTDVLIVTPDFKISAPRNLMRSIRRTVSTFAHFVKSDFMDQWEITQSSIARAADEGLTSAEIIETLTAHSTFPPPKNVTDSIRIWEEQRKCLIYHHGPVLIVENESDERFVREVITSKDGLLSNPAPNIFILNPGKADAIMEKIRTRREVGKIAIPRGARTNGSLTTLLKKRQSDSKARPEPVSFLNIVTL